MKLAISTFLACAWIGSSALAADSIGVIHKLSGQAVAQGEDGDTRTLSRGGAVYVHDRLRTEKASSLTMVFDDGTIVGIGPNSEMTIDDYMFNPKVREENHSSFQILRGVARFITDKITKLNPERFDVRTRYGGIGIRGCDIGCRLDEDRDYVYIIALHDADSVVVSLNPDVKSSGGLREIAVTEDGQTVVMSPDEGLLARPMDATELQQLEVEIPPSAETSQVPHRETATGLERPADPVEPVSIVADGDSSGVRPEGTSRNFADERTVGNDWSWGGWEQSPAVTHDSSHHSGLPAVRGNGSISIPNVVNSVLDSTVGGNTINSIVSRVPIVSDVILTVDASAMRDLTTKLIGSGGTISGDSSAGGRLVIPISLTDTILTGGDGGQVMLAIPSTISSLTTPIANTVAQTPLSNLTAPVNEVVQNLPVDTSSLINNEIIQNNGHSIQLNVPVVSPALNNVVPKLPLRLPRTGN